MCRPSVLCVCVLATLLVTDVLHLLVHVYRICCQHIYASVIVSDDLNGCSRLTCLVLETTALCDIFVRSAVYKSSYLLTYCKVTCHVDITVIEEISR